MKENNLRPAHWDGETVVQFTEPCEVTKKLTVSVPNQYQAIAYIDEKVCFRVQPCLNRPVAEHYGREFLGSQIQIAFLYINPLPQMAWGFGNIQVNNDRLREAYRVGANGKFVAAVTDYAKLINVFPFGENITLEHIREKSLSAIKSVGIPILASYFSDTDISVFEISSLVGEIRERMKGAAGKDDIFVGMGLAIESLTVDGIHVNEDDLEMIRNRMNEEI